MTEPNTDQPSRDMLDQEIAQMLDQDAPMAQAFARVATIDRRRHEQATRNLSVDVAAALTRRPSPGQRWGLRLGIAVPSMAAVAAVLYVVIGTTPQPATVGTVTIGTAETPRTAIVVPTTPSAAAPSAALASASKPSAAAPASQRVSADVIIADLAVDYVVDQLLDARIEDENVVRITEAEIDNLFVGL